MNSKFAGAVTIIIGLLPLFAYGQSQNYLSRYIPSTYKAGPSIYHLIKDHRNVYYFATNRGILEYDGSEWRIIDAGNFSDIKFIGQAEDQTIYIGANNDFGFLAPDSTGDLKYQSLVPYATEPLGEFNEVWQIVFLDDKVYFQSYSGIFEWDGKKIRAIPSKNIFIFNIDGKLYGSRFGPTYDFGYFNEGEIENIHGHELYGEDAVYTVFPWNTGKHVLITSENGLFWLDSENEEITEFKSEASEYIKEHWFFDGIRIDDNTLVLGTWKGGVIIINNQGDILEIINKDSGLLANMVYHMVLGENRDLWLGTSDGIARIELDSLSIPFQFENINSSPHMVIRELVTNGDDKVYIRPFHNIHKAEMDTVIRFTEAPASLNFQYAIPSLAGSQISFRTQLVGFDNDWNAWTSSNTKEYTGITGRGEYTFNVMGMDEFGIETNIASIGIFIDIPWYQTPLKYLVVFPFSFLFIFLFIKLRTRKLEKIRVHLEETVIERTGDLIKKQKDLEKINEELETTNHELDSFVYHTTHDLKAPLKSVMGLISLSKKESFSNENLTLYLQMIEDSITKLEEFISSVIEYSVNAKTVTKTEKIDFDTIIDDVLEELKEFSQLKDIQINRMLSLDTTYHSDPHRIKIIMNNLITNAIKYHDLSKADPFININITRDNGSVHIDVSDNGIGIHEDHHDKVFDMFYRATDKAWGSGLGLYIIKETVTNLNGEIRLKSAFGSGTTFEIILPEN